MSKYYGKTIFNYSNPGRSAYSLPNEELDGYDFSNEFKRATELRLPEVSEIDVVRHYTKLST